MREYLRPMLVVLVASLFCVSAKAVTVNIGSETIPGDGLVHSVDVWVTGVAGAPDLAGYSLHLTHSPGLFQFASPWGQSTGLAPHPMVFTNPVINVVGGFVPADSDASNIYAVGSDQFALSGLPMQEGSGLLRVYFTVPTSAASGSSWNILLDQPNTYLSDPNGDAIPFAFVDGTVTVADFTPADATVPLPSAIAAGLPLLGLLGAMKMTRRRTAA